MDIYTPEKRSNIMSRVKSKNTRPEIVLRSLMHREGMRFRLHRQGLPGRPDIVLLRDRLAIFVHGCFWHQHPGCKRSKLPRTRHDWWRAKLERNADRDLHHEMELTTLGWTPIVVWECDLRNPRAVIQTIRDATPNADPIS